MTIESLKEFKIEGVTSNVDALERILSHPEFIKGRVNTSFLAENPELLNHTQSINKSPLQDVTHRKYSEEKKCFELIPPMTGIILEVRKAEGDSVEVGEVVLVLSAAKIETEIMSPVKGVVKEINCVLGEQAFGDKVVAVLEGYEEIRTGRHQ